MVTRVRMEADAVIVGAGASGAFFAARLAEAGKNVLVLDAGPAWTKDDLISNQVWSRRLRWGGAPVLPAGDHPFGYGFNFGWGLGGAALHHYGTWPRMHPSDFRMQSQHGQGFDWPISYDDLRPYYDRMQDEAGVSGDAEAEVWRPDGAPYPLPPLEVLNQGEALKRGFDALGIPIAPAPMAILSREYKGRPPCIYDGWCDAGCPIDALYNPLISDIPRAKAAGALFKTGCTVVKVLSEGDRAVGLEYVNERGERRTVRADLVVLAGSVVGNPALMLNSASDEHPEGLANRNGLVGKYFMTHAMAPVYGLFEDETAPYMGVNGAQLICHEGYEKARADGPFGSYQWLVAPAAKPNDMLGVAMTRADIFGQDLHDFMARANHHLGTMFGFCEETPRAENRIELSDQDGPHGEKLARLVHSFDENSVRLRDFAKDEGLRILKAADAQEAWQGPLANAHMMGGTIMGDDPAASVTDSYGRSHEVGNLIIAGSGLFPTGGAVNPTFTIYALAMRSTEHIIANWSDYAG
ncbi:MAG: GMC family oxidoreductase [Pseudomonadota bacterium]